MRSEYSKSNGDGSTPPDMPQAPGSHDGGFDSRLRSLENRMTAVETKIGMLFWFIPLSVALVSLLFQMFSS